LDISFILGSVKNWFVHNIIKIELCGNDNKNIKLILCNCTRAGDGAEIIDLTGADI